MHATHAIDGPAAAARPAPSAAASRPVQQREVEASLDGRAGENLLYAWRLRGPLDAARLAAAVAALARRHEPLRTTFATVPPGPPAERAAEHPPPDGADQRQSTGSDARPTVLQLIAAEPPQPLPWSERPVTGATSAARLDAARAAAAALGRAPFPLADGPLWRVALLHVGDDDAVLALAVAHIVWDAWSAGRFLRELLELHARPELAAGLEPPPLQLADVAAWERTQGADAAAGRATGPHGDGAAGLLHGDGAAGPPHGDGAAAPSHAGGAPARPRAAGGDARPAAVGALPAGHLPAQLQARLAPPAVGAGLAALARELRTTPSVVCATACALAGGTGNGCEPVPLAVADARREDPQLAEALGCLVGHALVEVPVARAASFGELATALRRELRVRRPPQLDALLEAEPDATCDRSFNFVPAGVAAALDGPAEPVGGIEATRVTGLPEAILFPARARPWRTRLEWELWSRPDGAIDATLVHDARSLGARAAERLAVEQARLLRALAAPGAARATVGALLAAARVEASR